MHVLVCIGSNVQQFHTAESVIQLGSNVLWKAVFC